VSARGEGHLVLPQPAARVSRRHPPFLSQQLDRGSRSLVRRARSLMCLNFRPPALEASWRLA
jgi:hypothetical protein